MVAMRIPMRILPLTTSLGTCKCVSQQLKILSYLWCMFIFTSSYKVKDDKYGQYFGHEEKRDGHNTYGNYYVNLPDGRLQTVNYKVDGYSGYQAEVKYQGGSYH